MMEVEGTITTHKGESVPFCSVYNEPMHEARLKNEYVYVYEACFCGKDAETSWHRHSADTLYICLHNGAQALNRPSDRDEFVHNAKRHDLWWAMAKENPYVHQVKLLSEGQARFFGMEMNKSPPLCSKEPLTAPCYTLNEAYSTNKARVYQLDLPAGASTGRHTWNFSGIVIALATSTLVDNVAAATEGEAAVEEEGATTATATITTTTTTTTTTTPFAEGSLSEYAKWMFVSGPVTVDVRNEGPGAYQALVVEMLDF